MLTSADVSNTEQTHEFSFYMFKTEILSVSPVVREDVVDVPAGCEPAVLTLTCR